MERKKNLNVRFLKAVFWLLTALGGIGLLFPAVLYIVAVCSVWKEVAGQAASIGIIGGADGPTAIFVTTQPGAAWNLLLPVLLLAAGICGLLWLRKKRTE